MKLHDKPKKQPVLCAVTRAGNGYNAFAPEYPGCLAADKTPESAKKRLQRALAAHLDAMVKDGVPVCEDCDYSFIDVRVPARRPARTRAARSGRRGA